MEKQFLKTIKKYNMITEGDTIIVGLSGGCDSVTLFTLLQKYRKELKIDIIAVHVNHLIRKESFQDEKFCKELCKKHNTILHTYWVDINEIAKNSKLSSEEAGRKARYELFSKHCEDSTYKIAIAHNKNDVAETFLMRLFRGSGVKGLISITPRRGNVIRPIIEIEREELEKYLDGLGQEYCNDKTNFMPIYTRNKVRLEVLPKIEEDFNPNIISTLYETSKILEEEQLFIDSLINDVYDKIVGYTDREAIVDLVKLRGEQQYLQKQVLIRVISKFIPNNKNINKKHINGLIDLIKSDYGHKSLDFPNNLVIRKNYDTLVFSYKHEENKVFNAVDLNFDELLYLPSVKKYVYATILDYDGILEQNLTSGEKDFKYLVKNIPKDIKINIEKHKFFCYDSVYNCSNLKIRSRKNGDKIFINNVGTKKLKDYFIDKKVEKNQRDLIPLITTDDSVLWVLDDFNTVNSNHTKIEEKKKVILILLMEDNNGKGQNWNTN